MSTQAQRWEEEAERDGEDMAKVKPVDDMLTEQIRHDADRFVELMKRYRGRELTRLERLELEGISERTDRKIETYEAAPASKIGRCERCGAEADRSVPSYGLLVCEGCHRRRSPHPPGALAEGTPSEPDESLPPAVQSPAVSTPVSTTTQGPGGSSGSSGPDSEATR